ncbi:cuticle protein AM1199-like [Portunus trituberculatus]|uniref:Endocuticle structural glycoprotein SgAbd-1 n=1 Tax=Portunus trituberculatus TaxID=210409 RepID=A0A5B7DRU9_PORTR|nr:cuticle protein AM1199-like [Portunus trituberculatus]MPC23819.1 Endocuticle structural glycoprotein SgAbd-1 [Portunus trituberculatus]
MKAVVMMMLLTVAVAEKLYAPSPSASASPVSILKDDRVHPDAAGNYVFDVETEDGIVRHESGSEGGSQQGFVSYTAPDGTPVHIKFVADEKGYQPDSDLLPVAPAFPHPIPQYVLDQIAKAAAEDAAQSIEVREPTATYSQP